MKFSDVVFTASLGMKWCGLRGIKQKPKPRSADTPIYLVWFTKDSRFIDVVENVWRGMAESDYLSARGQHNHPNVVYWFMIKIPVGTGDELVTFIDEHGDLEVMDDRLGPFWRKKSDTAFPT